MLGLIMAVSLCGMAGAPQGLGSVEIEISDSVTISTSDEERQWFANLMPLTGNTFVVSVQRAADEINPAAMSPLQVISKDAGRTWSGKQTWPQSGNSWTRRKDGSYLWLSYLLMYQDEHVAKIRVGRSQDGLDYTWSDGTVDVSPNSFGKGPKGTAAIVAHRSILEMADGTLLATMYGRFAEDTLDRSIVASSADGGTTWKLLSTIGYNPAVGGEGLNEPCMVRLADGSLFCFMRNQSTKPMYWARSENQGKSWTTPQQMPEEYAALSVDPCLILLSNGALACSAGRPDCHFMLSLDGTGKTWTKPVAIFTGPTTSYTSICELPREGDGPVRLFYLHDVTPEGWKMPKKGSFHEVRGVFLTVNPKTSTAPP